MHITIVAIGSRGDIQPYIALGQGLQQAGYRVRLNTHLDFEALVRELDLEFAPLLGIPFFADQPFWSEHAYRLGVGPHPIPRKKLTAENLATAIKLAVNDQSIRRHAARSGELVRSEDGVQRAVEIIQRYYV